MIPLRARALEFNGAGLALDVGVLRVSRIPHRPASIKAQEVYVAGDGDIPDGFAWYIVHSAADFDRLPAGAASVAAPDQAKFLGQGDVIAVDPRRKAVRVHYRRSSPYNHFLLTERCNNYCLMCSQPPRDVDDAWVAQEVLRAIPLVDRDAAEIGFTGGEPTLLGERFLELVQAAAAHLPRTALHILSNGRRFADGRLAARLGAIGHHDLMMGIPVYADLAHVHDHVVQADGAFDETIRGILALKASRVRVEIRVVLLAQTVKRLPELARFIARNLLFVDHVALMGLEPTGFARANMASIWADPIDYADQLEEAVRVLSNAGIRTSVYNSQLCVLPASVRPFARRSISDWKQTYLPVCATCEVRNDCAGFFASVTYARSRGIKPLVSTPAAYP
ncbi:MULTISPECIES: His-Xaa-Ser system radical SAM maturase HxsC [unclassified Novosphingobium]|uniref:His-Xaa-Ser system radical SAM maturase HxsC n=1 Tax=unclassified Novosphingobium TaxID=2644732 RepID=UPI0010BD04E8|nr:MULTISPECIES: His-Xaa-Ser system radical SAM maturase HxsC [unclassified Novosphingobium]QCI96349.1 His-Xaa-Ser system radical SAM maturase HxsC [Novosphingobium sp. EMRT-2]